MPAERRAPPGLQTPWGAAKGETLEELSQRAAFEDKAHDSLAQHANAAARREVGATMAGAGSRARRKAEGAGRYT
ncbi:MAG: hypothetical protein EB824_06340 [Thaumarchaeota archaeon S15]|nr:MAG: hypothetical protein EB824_06340 [Thaumarchaeota archaeon S15]